MHILCFKHRLQGHITIFRAVATSGKGVREIKSGREYKLNLSIPVMIFKRKCGEH